MPSRRKANRVKRVSRSRGQVSVPQNVAPFARSKFMNFQYTNTGLFAESAAGTGFQGVWAINGMYDPDITHPGHQPMYFDQLFSVSGPYYRYTVVKVWLEIEVVNTSNFPIVFGAYFQPGPVDYPSLLALQEKPLGVKALLPQSPVAGCRRLFKLTMPVHKVLGVPPAKIVYDDPYSGLYNSNPSQIAYFVNMIYGITNIASATVRTSLKFRAKAHGMVAASTS